MDKRVNKMIPIIDEYNHTIFDCNLKFQIPIYQRGYEWEENNIEKLIDDVMDNKDATYYLGILVISKNSEGKYEIIDGQQRLTTLYLILSSLGIEVHNLEFSYRDKSNDFLKNIKKIVDDIKKGKKTSSINDNNMYEKLNSIIVKLSEYEYSNIIEQFKKAVLIVTELNTRTDLNHYFEVMNIRGEQLLQSDIVKSKLMQPLNGKDRKIFSEIWEACTDMNSYIQMNFKYDIRKELFGYYWNIFIPKDYTELRKIVGKNIEFQPFTNSIKQVIKGKSLLDKTSYDEEEIVTIYNKDRETTRFKSIIEFKNFILHVLKVFVNLNIKENEKISLDELIIDTKTTENFKLVFEKEIEKLNFENTSQASKSFIYLLLKTRFLFDNYIIKREYKGNTDGNWSLYYGKKGNTKDSITFSKSFKNSNNIMMLQSLLRVTYTSPRIMHWITELLIELNKEYEIDSIKEEKIELFIENYIRGEIKKTEFYKEKKYAMGLDTPRLIFNYLDYLLWKKYNSEYAKFEFEFRNSVEHFYPQHPDGFPEWNSKKNGYYLRDSFGNLCLVTTSFNSHLSNLAPSAKKDSNISEIEKGSIKLREMCKYIKDSESNYAWKETLYQKHQDAMLKILLENLEKSD